MAEFHPPLVCICIPTYNCEKTIRETLRSIVNQSYRNLIIQIVDNASNDDTVAVVEAIEDSRITIYRNDVNIGAEGNFTRCIQLAKGKYTGIFHADDLYEQDMLAKQVALLELNQELGAVFTAATTIDEGGKPFGIMGRSVDGKQDTYVYKSSELIKAVLERSNFLICPSAMVRTVIYQKEIMNWRGDLFRSSADLDVWLRIAGKHPIAILNEALMRYRVDSQQYSNAVRMRTERADIFLVLDQYLSRSEVNATLSSADRQHYRQLEINDQVWRAINLFTMGRVGTAKLMLRGTFNGDAIHAALTSRRGLLTLLASVSLSLVIALGAEKMGQIMIQKLREATKK